MSLGVHMLQARHGDAFIVQAFSRSGRPSTVVIDGGPDGTFQNVLAPALVDVARGAPLDLVVASHVDDDHIHGVIDLVEAGQHDVRSLWHNSFDDLVGSAVSADSQQIHQIREVFADRYASFYDKEASLTVVASITQGRDLRDLLKARGLDGNPPFAGLITGGMQCAAGDLDIEVVAPSAQELERLRRSWEREVRAELNIERAARFAAASIDQSITNLASIVFLVQDGRSSVLMTGDARGDSIVSALDAAGHLRTGPLRVNGLKVPHHGSERSCSRELFENVYADAYFISGDGRHGNPSLETCHRLMDSRKGASCDIYFSNAVPGVTDAVEIYAAMNTRHQVHIARGNVTSIDL